MTSIRHPFGYTTTGSKVLIEIRTPPTSAIELPACHRQPQTQGVVRSVGPLVKDLKPGDSVMFENLSGSEVTINGRLHKVMREMEVLAVVETI